MAIAGPGSPDLGDSCVRAAQIRFNVAIDLNGAGRPANALEYARAALRGFESYGESAADMIQRTRQVIETIEQHL